MFFHLFRSLFLDEVKINNLAALLIKIVCLNNSCLLKTYWTCYHQNYIHKAGIDMTCCHMKQIDFLEPFIFELSVPQDKQDPWALTVSQSPFLGTPLVA